MLSWPILYDRCPKGRSRPYQLYLQSGL